MYQEAAGRTRKIMSDENRKTALQYDVRFALWDLFPREG
jgi:hypothetical protein